MGAISLLLVMSMGLVVVFPKDVCISSGILKPINRIRIHDYKSRDLAINMNDVISYAEAINLDTDGFIAGLSKLVSNEEITSLVKYEGLKLFNGKFNALLLEVPWVDAIKECGKKRAKLLNFDYSTNREAAVKFMKLHNMAETALDTMGRPPILINTHGEVLHMDTTSRSQNETRALLSSAHHPTFKVDNTIDIKAAPSGDQKIICLVEIGPTVPKQGQTQNKGTLIRIANQVIDLAKKFKLGYQTFNRLSNGLDSLTSTNVKEILFPPSFSLVEAGKFLSRHQFENSFRDFKFEDLKQLNEVKKVFKNLLKYFKADNKKIEIPIDLIELDSKYENVKVKGRTTNSQGIVEYVAEAVQDETNDDFLITHYEFFPFTYKKESIARLFIIAKGPGALSSGEMVTSMLNYKVIGSDCKNIDNILHCSRYIPGKITAEQINCAKFVLGVGEINGCKMVNGYVSGIRTDCDQVFGSKVMISTPENIEIKIVCNKMEIRTHSLNPGLHQIDTNCAVHHLEDILVPQVLSADTNFSTTTIVRNEGIITRDILGEVFWEYMLPVILGMLILFLVCTVGLCYFIDCQRCLHFWCRCFKKGGRNGAKPNAPTLAELEELHKLNEDRIVYVNEKPRRGVTGINN